MRAGAAAFFAPPAVAGLNTVFRGEPRDVPVNAYLGSAAAGTPTGAIAFFFIEDQDDHFETMQGSSVQGRWVRYRMAMALRVRSLQQTGEQALDDHDAIVDATIARLRADPTMGGVSHLFQAGTGDWRGSTEDIHVASGQPRPLRKGGPIVIWSALRFWMVEIL